MRYEFCYVINKYYFPFSLTASINKNKHNINGVYFVVLKELYKVYIICIPTRIIEIEDVVKKTMSSGIIINYYYLIVGNYKQLYMNLFLIILIGNKNIIKIHYSQHEYRAK